jgi:hypothetical protein
MWQEKIVDHELREPLNLVDALTDSEKGTNGVLKSPRFIRNNGRLRSAVPKIASLTLSMPFVEQMY